MKARHFTVGLQVAQVGLYTRQDLAVDVLPDLSQRAGLANYASTLEFRGDVQAFFV